MVPAQTNRDAVTIVVIPFPDDEALLRFSFNSFYPILLVSGYIQFYSALDFRLPNSLIILHSDALLSQ